MIFNIFLALFGFMFSISQVFSQGITHVEINGPGTATMDTQTLFSVTFWDSYVQVPPPQNGSYYWYFTGASQLEQTKSSLRLDYNTSGEQFVTYDYSTFDNYYSDYITVQVEADNCSGINASAQDVFRTGPGTVILTADPAPSGFTYKWFASDQITQVGTAQNFTTPSLSSTTTYYLAYIHTASGCMTPKIPVKAIIRDHNYVKRYSAREPGLTETSVKTGTASQSYKNFTYYDGLGRPMQNVLKQASVSGWDIITPITYDEAGRQAKEYLPYSKSNGTGAGAYQETDLQDHGTFYSGQYSDTYGYHEKQFEPSPLSRVEKQAAPGNDWRLGSDHEVKYEYRPNTSNESVRIWTVNSSGLPVSSAAFGAGALWAVITTDEDGQKSIEYTDKQGRSILKKQQIWPTPSEGHQGWFCTYYVYDDFGDLRVVIPPLGVEKLVSNGWSFSTNTTMAEGLYFMYKYDGRRRMIEKRIPGKDWEYMVYDKKDRLVAMQDGNMKDEGKWLYTKYDALDRPVMTGITENIGSRSQIQASVDNMGSNTAEVNANTSRVKTGSTIISGKYDGFDEYVASTSVTLSPGFSFKASGNKSFTAKIGSTTTSSTGAFPADESEILTVIYYDDYDEVDAGNYSPASGYGSATSRTTALLTGKRVKDLVSGVFYESAYFYDEKGRPVQTLSEHQLGGTVRTSTKYDFEGKPMETLAQFTNPDQPDIKRTFYYNIAGQLESINHTIGGDTETLATYSYNELGEQTGKSHPGAGATLSFDYNIRGWLKKINEPGGSDPLFGMELYYQSGTSNNRFNGNIARQTWKGMDNVARRYDYLYDKANRLKWANFTPGSSENHNYTVGEVFYDGNGNILAMHRNNQHTSSTYGYVDFLEYEYDNDYSNRLVQVRDEFLSTTYTADDFIERSTTAYGYDKNGNQTSNLDKQIPGISYNHLNLPEEVTFTDNTGRIVYHYDAEGNKLKQEVYNGSTLDKTMDYIGEFVFRDGQLDYLVHEEGRVAYEENTYQYEYFIKDHLGNVRQVVRAPQISPLMATMEMSVAEEEEVQFEQLPESRQSGPEHNVTPGGDRVAWLNASRGRVLGPARTQEIQAGDSVRLSVHGKYRDPEKDWVNPGSFASSGAKGKLLADLLEFSDVTMRSGGPNAVTVFNMVDLLVKDLQQKEAPEAYMMYALYNSDSVLYRTGKQVLTKNAANQHEELEEELYISQDGYMEVFLVNETEEDVWYDNFLVQSTTALIVQETHYDPWGLELTGLGYQYGGIKVNKYLYQGKEFLEDLNLNIYDFHARGYDPVIGRTWQVDPMADSYYPWSPYAWVMNNPIKYMDPTGMFSTHTDEDGNVVAVYDDGDLGVYKHSSSEIEQAKSTNALLDRDLDKQQGFTLDINSFRQGDKINYSSFEARDWIDGFEARMNQGVAAFGNPISNLAWYAVNARNGHVYDPKSYLKEGSQLSYGVYISPRDIGNFAAGATARINGMSKLNMMLYYGAFELSENGFADFVQNINTYKSKALQIGHPTYGEGVISNTFQRIGYEGIRTISEFNKNYKKIWKD